MTIEEKYEELRKRAVAMREAYDMLGTEHEAKPPYDCPFASQLLAATCVHAKRIAVERWPEVRAVLASAGAPIPLRPVVFTRGMAGAVWRTYSSAFMISVHEEPAINASPWSAYLDAAESVAAAEFLPQVEAAEAAFERYRLAVAQGVAVAPEDGKADQ